MCPGDPEPARLWTFPAWSPRATLPALPVLGVDRSGQVIAGPSFGLGGVVVAVAAGSFLEAGMLQAVVAVDPGLVVAVISSLSSKAGPSVIVCLSVTSELSPVVLPLAISIGMRVDFIPSKPVFTPMYSGCVVLVYEQVVYLPTRS